jgi:hypothetical protein
MTGKHEPLPEHDLPQDRTRPVNQAGKAVSASCAGLSFEQDPFQKGGAHYCRILHQYFR